MRRDARAGVAVSLLLWLAGPCAAQTAWQPSPGHTQVPIWPGAVPDARPLAGPEVSGTVVDGVGSKRLVGGRPWVYVDRVSQPTVTVYPPEGRNTGAAVVVFPGGGYKVLGIGLEGTEAWGWLTSKGITCVLLKYRVPCVKSGPYLDCLDRKSTRLNSSHLVISYAVFCLKKKKIKISKRSDHSAACPSLT